MSGVGFDILLVGLDQTLLEFLSPLLAKIKYQQISTGEEVDSFLENYQLSPGTRVLISTNTKGMSHLEVGQALSSCFQGLHLVFVTFDRTSFEIEKLKKNGFTDSFLFPLDKKSLHDLIEDVTVSKAGGITKKYKAVKLLDVEPGQDLPFAVKTYLPFNNKYVLLTGSGQLSAQKAKLLKEKNVNSVFIDSKQVEKFYEFASEQLIKQGKSSNDAVSQTEKAEKMQSTVRSLFRSVLDSTNSTGDFSNGRDLLDQSKKIVENYVEKKTGVDLAEKLKSIMGEGRDAYSHAQIVSTISCLLSMATEIGNPEDLAIAGLFHDIGIYGIKEDISVFEIDRLTEEEKKQYYQHPRLSLNLLKEKRITLTPKISEIIEKHHERVDGKGFPDGLQPHRIPIEAHLLAYADAFEYLTRQSPGKASPTPQEVHQIISSKLGLSTEMLKKVENFLSTLQKSA